MTQADIAKKINLTIMFISSIELGKSVPSMETFVDIANALDTTPNYLLAGDIIKLRVVLNKEIEEIVKDLTHSELKIIIDMLKTNKEAIRKAVSVVDKKNDKK